MEVLQEDPYLQELVTVPFLLGVLLQMYETDRDTLLASSPAQRRTLLIQPYVAFLLGRKSSQQHDTGPEMVPYLAWLARQMRARHAATFSLALVQPDWLGGDRAQKRYHTVVTWLMGGLQALFGSVSGLLYGVSYGWRYGPVSGLLVGSVAAVVVLLIGVLRSGWSERGLVADQRERSDAGRRSLVRSRRFVLFGGIVNGLLSGFCLWFAAVPGWATLALGYALVSSVLFSFQFWSAYWIEQAVLRWFLWRQGVIPRRYAAFLAYAADRALLGRVGGAYQFASPWLFDYFARLDEGARVQERVAHPGEP
jgi:hypothetical protein